MARRAESSLLDREHEVVVKSSLRYSAFSDHHSMGGRVATGRASIAQPSATPGLVQTWTLTALNKGWEQIPIAAVKAVFTALTSTTEDPPSGAGRVVSGVFHLKLSAKGKASSLGVDALLDAFFSFLWLCYGHKQDQSPRLALTKDGRNTVSKFTA